jgi:heparan-sulfate lyase
LDNYYTQEKYLQQNYSKRGNHLLFEAQRIIWATTFFPELKHSKEWRREAINILKSQMDVQVYPDGVQYELSPNYHVAVINIFWRAANMMRLNGLKSKLGNSYFNTMKKMIMALVNFSFPDYTYPMFGDAKLITKRVIKRDYNRWLKVFPNNGVIRYYATDGGAGHPPTYLSKGLTSGGFYTFRNGWDKHSTVMVLKASPPGFFHNQPDNSTFVLWINGRRYTPDSGSYIYGGGSKVEKQRNWFRATRHHQTLTLDDKNIKIDKAHLIKWQTGDTLDVLSYKNPSYNNLTHQRTVFFVDHKFFVFVDEAKGNATGKINLHFQLAENSHPTVKKQQNKVYTSYTKGKNLAIQSFSSHPMQYVKEEGRVSYSYKEYKERPAFSFQQAKNDGKQVNYITILYPYKGNNPPQMQAKFSEDNNFSNNQFSLAVTINGEKYFIHQNMDD